MVTNHLLTGMILQANSTYFGVRHNPSETHLFSDICLGTK